MKLRRLFMSRKRRATVDYLTRLIEADRSRAAARHLDRHLSSLPDGPCRQRPRPEPTSSGSPDSPVRVLVIDEADVATNFHTPTT